MVHTDNPNSTPSTPCKKEGESVPKISLFGTCSVPTLSSEIDHQNIQALASIRCVDKFEEERRAKLVIVAVVDTSSSMRGHKIESLKTTLCFLCSKLSDNDQLGIVTYSTESSVYVPLTNMTKEGRASVTKAIDDLAVFGSTNLCDGLSDGIRLLPINQPENSDTVTSVLLMTDGLCNIGTTSSTGILAQMQHCLKDHPGVAVNTFGYGSSHDASLLEKIAEASEGTYFFIESDESISGSFADCLGGLLSVVGQSVEIVIKSTENSKLGAVNCKYQCTNLPSGDGVRLRIGNIQAGEERDILFEFSVPSVTSSEESSPVVNIQLSYFDVESEVIKELSSTINISRKSKNFFTDEDNIRSQLVDKHHNRMATSLAISKASELSDNHEIDVARSVLEKTIDIIEKSVSKDDPLCVTMVKELENAIKDLSNPRGSCRLRQTSTSLRTQRSSARALFDSAVRQKIRFDSADFEMNRSINTPKKTFTMPSRPRFQSVRIQRFDSADFEFTKSTLSSKKPIVTFKEE